MQKQSETGAEGQRHTVWRIRLVGFSHKFAMTQKLSGQL